MRPTFEGKSVVVTGAGGSIGSQLCCRAAMDNAKRLVLVSLTESGLYNIERHLRKQFGKYRDTEIVPILGSVEDDTLMSRSVTGADIVIHTAAHKHVPICEANPVSAIRNNVFGTLNLIHCSLSASVKQFCLISSDKAVNPASIMGATKRLAESLVTHFSEIRNDIAVQPGDYFTVRFGNVMDSAGSVLPLWREQIAAGGPLTLTDERCERYFMTIEQAVGLIADVIGTGPDRGTFVLDMGKPKKLIDIAKELIGVKKIEVQLTGLRPGEKLTEELHHGGTLAATMAKGVFLVNDQIKPLDTQGLAELRKLVRHREDKRAVAKLWELVK